MIHIPKELHDAELQVIAAVRAYDTDCNASWKEVVAALKELDRQKSVHNGQESETPVVVERRSGE